MAERSVEIRYFEAPWLPGSYYAQVVGQEWINATAPTVQELRDYIRASYNAHHTGEPAGWGSIDDSSFTRVDPPSWGSA